MKLKIDEKTKWNEIYLLLSENDSKELQRLVTDMFPFDFYQITIGDFSLMLSENPKFPNIDNYDFTDLTAFEYFRIKNAQEFLVEFSNDLKKYEISRTNEEYNAESNLPEFSLIEIMLCFTRNYFNLQNYGEAEKITLIEYLLARKDDYTKRLYDKNITDEFARKSKRGG